MDASQRLHVELERAALYAIARTYEHVNGSLFRFRLRAPAFELTDGSERLGRWLPQPRTIELSRRLLVEHGWGVLEEVLKHEMAHQYVHEVLQVHGEPAHGPAFRKICEERGIDARAAGAPVAAAEQAKSPILERIAKLLALAESPNEHEAQAAMSAAQRLMLKHNIEAAITGASSYSFRHLGKPSGRVSEHERRLALILDEHFFVQVIWVPVWRPLEAKRGSVLEVCGSRDNVELAAYVYDFLMYTADALYRADRRQRRDRSHQARRKFLAGVMAGFHQRLERERERSNAEGLVWVGDPELGGYFRRRHPHVRWARHSVSTGGEAYSRGQTAGRNIVLHRGVKTGPSAEVRLLPGASRDR
jgi:predicted SprT family Zn-dependent metalloprotease